MLTGYLHRKKDDGGVKEGKKRGIKDYTEIKRGNKKRMTDGSEYSKR